MALLTRTSFRKLQNTLSFLLAVVTMLQGCAQAKNGGETLPAPTAAPSIASLSQASGPVGTSVTIARDELWSDAGHQHGDLQRDGGDADELECGRSIDGAGTERSDDGECGGHGRRAGEQRSELHGDDGCTEHRESESGVRTLWELL